MSKVTTNFRKTASACALALVAALIPVAASSPASAAAISSGSLNVVRNFDSNTSTFKAYQGESIYIYYSNTIDLSSVNVGDVLTFSESVGDVTGWQLNWVANNNYGSSVRTATYTVPEPKPTRLEVSVNKSYTANVDKMTGFVPSVTIGGVAVPSNGEFTVPQVTKTVTDTGYTAKPEDTQLTFNFRVCVDMTKVAPGDDVELSTVATGEAQAVQGGYTGWLTNTGSIQSISPQTDNQRTIPDPEPTSITVELNRSFVSLTSGTTYAFSADIKKGSTSVTLASCPNQGGGGQPPAPGLFPIGGASINGKFTVNSNITVTTPKWSLTAGGTPVTTTNRVFWLVCDAPLPTSTTSSMNIPCFNSGGPPREVLAGGTSVGITNGPNQSFTGSSLKITQGLLTAMTGKHLMVVVVGNSGTAPSIKSGNIFMKSCGPIASGSTCSSTFGTPAVVKKNPKLPTVAKSVKAKKSVTVKLHASKGTSAKGANSDGLATVVSVASSSKKICSVAKVVNKKTKKITGYTVKGLKAGKCSVVVTITGNSAFNSLKKTMVVTVKK